MNSHQDHFGRFLVHGWSRRFDEPIELAGGHKIKTLRDSILWLARTVPKAEHGAKDVQTAARCVSEAAETNGSMLLAHLSMMVVINRIQHLGSHSLQKPTVNRSQKQNARWPGASRPVGIATRAAVVAPATIKQALIEKKNSWHKRLIKLRYPHIPSSLPSSPTVLTLLERVQTSGGSIYWKENKEPNFEGLNEAVRLGYIVRLSGTIYDGITLTKRGRRALGLELPQSMLQKIARWIKVGYWR
jgi:hypothetical protein